MSKTMTVATTVTVPGITSQQRSVELTANNDVESEVSVDAGKPGQLTTRTDANTGVLTMESGHGFSTSDKLDVFWDGGSRTGMTATVAGDAVTVDGGSGDDLPDNLTEITAALPTSYNFAFDGDDAVSASVYSSLTTTPTTTDWNGYVHFTTSGDVVVQSYKLSALLPSNSWDGADVATNPFAGQTIAKVKYSNGNDAARTFGAVVLYD